MSQHHFFSSVGKPFHLNGLKNVGELDLTDPESGDEKCVVGKKGSAKSILADILGEARGDNQKDTVTPEKEKDKQRHTCENSETPHNFSLSTLPSIIDLQRVQQALRDGSAFQRSSHYHHHHHHHPPDAYHPERPHLSNQIFRPKSGKDLGALFSSRKQHHADPRAQNYSSVSFCDHVEFYIDWDPQDPENRHGSFRPCFQRFEDRLPWTEHAKCAEPDVLEKMKKLAVRIVRKFEERERERLTLWDRRDGLEPRRAPPLNRVEREVMLMYSQLRRGRPRGVGGKEKKTLRKTAEKKIVKTGERKRLHKTMKRVSSLGGYELPIKDEHDDRLTRSSKNHGQDGASLKVVSGEKQKRSTRELKETSPQPKTPNDDNEDEYDAQLTRDSKRHGQNGAALKVISSEKQKKPSEKSNETSPQPQDPKNDNKNSSGETNSGKASKQNTRTEPETAATDASKTIDGQKDPANQVPATKHHPPTSHTAIIAETKPVTKKRKTPPPTPPLPASSPLPKPKKRKVSPAKTPDPSPRKRTRRPFKSAAVIEDSDEETNYQLPEIAHQVRGSGARQGWNVEAKELIEEVRKEMGGK
ncbi:hypothetical protein ACJQWK_09188 [Exserohilum turcicum]|uniref:Uncharacterized protein n=1 Tax=Exserohilum turcicum (strain 28A) TaxID=671987 RepID=R0IXQ7_EXST2|nr:uncharacterized protein SETTUDRAFT_26590 [Exserohilum turcica Et28A]EOA89366.1 hypothetical protein SETTUDRAFT_26590 [Exserohilum turcica Et28A]